MQEKITFKNRRGQALAGVLHHPTGKKAHACAVFAHCFTCTKNNKAAVRISESLASDGLAVLRFDFTGLGQSEGDFSSTHFSSNVDDLVDAAAFMSSRDLPPSLLIGHSLGGTAVLAAAPEVDSAVAVATIGSPANASHVLGLLEEELPAIESQGQATVNLAGRPFDISRDFVEDVRTQAVCENLPGLRKALLVMHSPVDEVVSIDQAALIYSQAKHPKSFITLDDADHLMTHDGDSIYAARLLSAWASRYIGFEADGDELLRRVPGAAVVRGNTSEGMMVSVNADGHRFIADEPPALGGSGLGPTPYDLLGAALASCTVMTLNYFARRENLPLEQVEVSVAHDRIHAEDCVTCEKTNGKIDRFSRDISVRGDLDDEQRNLLLKIADRCPVHKTLENEITVVNHMSMD
ncbi:MAG: OsmC family protein [Xanthomonadales bacterium]|nr:OsmC family protein [Xanthomonadales bacterium]